MRQTCNGTLNHMTNKITEAMKQVTKPKYYFNREADYEELLNRNIGFVVNGFIDKDGTKIDSVQNFKYHKLPCYTLERTGDKGKRTKPYGKLCHIDENILIEDCRQRTNRKYEPIPCKKCLRMYR